MRDAGEGRVMALVDGPVLTGGSAGECSIGVDWRSGLSSRSSRAATASGYEYPR